VSSFLTALQHNVGYLVQNRTEQAPPSMGALVEAANVNDISVPLSESSQAKPFSDKRKRVLAHRLDCSVVMCKVNM